REKASWELSQYHLHLGADGGGAIHHVDTAFAHHLLLGSCAFVGTGYDGASVAHGAAYRSRLTSDEADHGFLAVVLDPMCGLDLQCTADLTDHYDGFGLGVVGEKLDGFQRGGTDDRVSTDTDGRSD